MTKPRQRRNAVYRFLKLLQYSGRKIFKLAEGVANAAFGQRGNPFYYLGGLSVFSLYVLLVTGAYLYAFYDVEATGAYDSIERLTHGQWYFGGVMRSLHRYAADAMVVTMILHMMRRFFNSRYNGARSFSWITGVPMLWTVFITGISGYWLVWDKMAQYSSVRTFEWIDWLPIIAEPTARNLLYNTGMSSTLFRLLVTTHIGLTLFLVAAVLIHTFRLNKPKINPPKRLRVGFFLALLLLSFINPAVSHEPADLSTTVGILNLDWFYMFIYPLMDIFSMGPIWVLVVVGTFFIFFLPWLPPKRRDPVAVVDLAQCSGCNLCVLDCPYEAIRLYPRADGRRHFVHEARVVNSKCTSCGICTGSCPFSTPFRQTEVLKSAIEMPHSNTQHLLDATSEALQRLSGKQRIIVFGCDYGMDVTNLNRTDMAGVSLECIGMLPPSFIDYCLRHGADGVFITGCRDGDCYHRLGNDLIEQRLNGERKPKLSGRVASERVGLFMAAEADRAMLLRKLDTFYHSLPATDDVDGHAGEKKGGDNG